MAVDRPSDLHLESHLLLKEHSHKLLTLLLTMEMLPDISYAMILTHAMILGWY